MALGPGKRIGQKNCQNFNVPGRHRTLFKTSLRRQRCFIDVGTALYAKWVVEKFSGGISQGEVEEVIPAKHQLVEIKQ